MSEGGREGGAREQTRSGRPQNTIPPPHIHTSTVPAEVNWDRQLTFCWGGGREGVKINTNTSGQVQNEEVVGMVELSSISPPGGRRVVWVGGRVLGVGG